VRVINEACVNTHDMMVFVTLPIAAAAAWVTTCARRTRVHVSVLRLLHRVRFFLHTQPVHRRHHRQLQCTEEKGDIVIDSQTLFCHCLL